MLRNKKLQTTHAALPIVAQAWGQKFGVKIQIGGNTAMTDGKTIVIPNVNESFGSLEPIWGYLLHEAMHVKDTDFSVERRGEFFSSLVNIFEDVRIERDALIQYPGAKPMLDACATYMVDQDHYSMVAANEPPARIVASFCLYYGQLHGVGQTFLQPYLDSAESALRASMPDLEKPLKDLIDESIKEMKSTQDAADYSRKVLELMKDLMDEDQQQPQQQANQSSSDQGDADGEQGDSSDQGSGDQGDGQGNDQSSGDNAQDDQDGQAGDQQGSDQGEGDDGQGDSSDQNSGSQGDDQAGDQADGQGLSQSQDSSGDQGGDTKDGQGKQSDQHADKQESSSQEQASQSSQSSGGSQARAIEQALNADPQDVLEDARDSLKRELFSQHDWSKPTPSVEGRDPDQSVIRGAARFKRAMSASAGLRRQFAGLLQSEQHTADRRSRTGRLGNNLSRVVQGDLRVFVRRGQRIETGAAVHVLVDRSGSMCRMTPNGQTWLDIAAESAATMAAAVETQPNSSCGLTFYDCDVIKAVKQGQRLAANKGNLGVTPGGSTATAQAILSVLGDLLAAKEERKVLFVVTDGEPNCEHQLREAIQLAQRFGVEVHGIGICLPSAKQHFESCIVINDVMDLRKELLTLARKSL